MNSPQLAGRYILADFRHFEGLDFHLLDPVGSSWVWPPHRIPVTTRAIMFLVGDPNLNLHLPLLLGRGHPQAISTWCLFFLGFAFKTHIFSILSRL